MLYAANEQDATSLRNLHNRRSTCSLCCKIFTRTYTRIRVGDAHSNYKPAYIYGSTYEFYPLTMWDTK